MQKKNINNTNRRIKTVVIFCTLFLIPLFAFTYIYAESIVKDKEVEDLTIYDSSSGFYEVPMSANIVPNNEKNIEYPTMAITDTLVLKDESSQSLGLSIYKLSTGYAVLHAIVGKGNESTHEVKPFGIGDFTAIKTTNPYICSELTLSQCKSSSEYIEEKLFSITLDGIDSVNTIVSSPAVIATSTILEDTKNTPAEDSVLVLASTTDLMTVKDESDLLILDTINPAESTLVLPSVDKTPEVTIQSINQNTAPLESESVINSDYSNNEEVKNADF